MLAAAVVTTLVATGAAQAAAAPANPAGGTAPFQVLDPQAWQNPDTMTWNDYKAVPGKNWADPSVSGSVRNFKIALVALDYPDETFAVSQRARSTVFGNPQSVATNIPRADVPKFYQDFLNTPNTLNKGHTLHEYWMQDSNGRYGVDLTGFGPYQIGRAHV